MSRKVINSKFEIYRFQTYVRFCGRLAAAGELGSDCVSSISRFLNISGVDKYRPGFVKTDLSNCNFDWAILLLGEAVRLYVSVIGFS